jgi:hypothetical protein
MLKIIKGILPVLIFCLLICSCSTKSENDEVLVKVNDNIIYKSQIDIVYEEFKNTSVTYDKIVDDSILELLVVQESPKYGISLSEDDLEHILHEFQELQPDIYKESVELYGLDNLKMKLKIRNLFTETKEYVLHNVIIKDNIIPHEVIESFTKDNNLVEQFAPFTDEQITNKLRKELEEYMFRKWMNNLRSSANIEYVNFDPHK